MATKRKHPGTPTYHSASARKGRRATNSVSRHISTPAEIERENIMRSFRVGVVAGFTVAAAVFSIILWLWVIPTMDAAVAAAQGAVA